MREAAAPRIVRGAGFNHSFKFSVRLPAKPSGVKTSPLRFLGIVPGRSARKSRRLEKKPWERGLWAPVKRGAESPEGNVTLGGGVLGSLHFGTIVLNSTCLIQRQDLAGNKIQRRHEWMSTGARLTCRQIHCNIMTLP